MQPLYSHPPREKEHTCTPKWVSIEYEKYVNLKIYTIPNFFSGVELYKSEENNIYARFGYYYKCHHCDDATAKEEVFLTYNSFKTLCDNCGPIYHYFGDGLIDKFILSTTHPTNPNVVSSFTFNKMAWHNFNRATWHVGSDQYCFKNFIPKFESISKNYDPVEQLLKITYFKNDIECDETVLKRSFEIEIKCLDIYRSLDLEELDDDNGRNALLNKCRETGATPSRISCILYSILASDRWGERHFYRSTKAIDKLVDNLKLLEKDSE